MTKSIILIFKMIPYMYILLFIALWHPKSPDLRLLPITIIAKKFYTTHGIELVVKLRTIEAIGYHRPNQNYCSNHVQLLFQIDGLPFQSFIIPVKWMFLQLNFTL